MSCLVLSMLTHFLITQPAPPIMRGMDSNYSCITFHFPFQIWCSTVLQVRRKTIKMPTNDINMISWQLWLVMKCLQWWESHLRCPWWWCCPWCWWHDPGAARAAAGVPRLGTVGPVVLMVRVPPLSSSQHRYLGSLCLVKSFLRKSFSENNELQADRTQANGPTPEEHNRTR